MTGIDEQQGESQDKRGLDLLEIESFVLIHTYHDMSSRAAFRADLDLSGVDKSRVEVLAPYTIGPEMIRCGRADCHTQHNHGFLIRTPEGLETNVGQDCGKTHFGAAFTVAGNVLKKAHATASKRIRINDVLRRQDEIRNRVRDLWDQRYGGKWLDGAISQFKRTYPAPVVHEILKRARLNDVDIYTATRREKDNDAQLGFRRDTKYETALAGRLAGLPHFATSVRFVLKHSILSEFEELVTAPLNDIGARQLNKYVEWIDALEEKFAEAELLIREGRRFFSEENLNQLPLLVAGTNAEVMAQRTRWDYESGTGTVLSEGQFKRWRAKQNRH